MRYFSICYSDEAKNDLRNIFMYIAYELKSRDNAEGQVNRFVTQLKSLKNFQKEILPFLMNLGKVLVCAA
jgi:plasmid stabilization system protein ParE